MEYFQKPNENMINNQVILNQMNSDSITVKTEVRQSLIKTQFTRLYVPPILPLSLVIFLFTQYGAIYIHIFMCLMVIPFRNPESQ